MTASLVYTNQEVLRAKIDLAERKYRYFVEEAWHIVCPNVPFVAGYHIDAICDHLQACADGQIRKLVINVPPRTSKSILTCVLFQPWVWARDQAKHRHFDASSQWLYSSHSQKLVIRDASLARLLMRSPWYQARWGNCFDFKEDQDSKLYYENTQGGARIGITTCTGTGLNADFKVVDDPHDLEGSESDKQRDAVCDWWDAEFSSRGNNPKIDVDILIMQRLHQRDLAGHLLARGDFEHLMLPMRYEPKRSCVTCIGFKDSDHRSEEGELLCPERFGEEEVKAREAALGTRAAGQLQQRPSPKGGSIFTEDAIRRYFREAIARVTEHSEGKEIEDAILRLRDKDDTERTFFETDCWWFQVCDTATKKGQHADYTVTTTFLLTPQYDLLIYDVWRAKLAVPEQYDGIIAQRAKYPRIIFQAVEDASSGTGIIQTGAINGKPFRPLKHGGKSKEERAVAASTMYNAGKIFHPGNTPHWRTALEDELITFPTGEHDDQVDTISYAAILVNSGLFKTLKKVKGPLLVWPAIGDGIDKPKTFAERYFGGEEKGGEDQFRWRDDD